MKPRLARALAASAAAILPLTVLAAQPAAASDPPPSDLAFSHNRILDWINFERGIRHLPPVRLAEGAHVIAQWSANVQESSGRLGHNPNLGNDVTNEVTPYWHTVGENVGLGRDADHLSSMWMNSPGHRANILNPAFDAVGIGTAYGNGGLWATVVFIDA